MCDQKHTNGSLITGVVIGGVIGAGLAFLFGTKKGKDLRQKIRSQYPEVFDNLEDIYADVVDQVAEVKKEVATLEKSAEKSVRAKAVDIGEAVENLGQKIQKASNAHRFVRSGHKL